MKTDQPTPAAGREPSEKFWREIDGMSKREVAELLHHTQDERDRAVEALSSALPASVEGSKEPRREATADPNDGAIGTAAYCHHRHHLDEHSSNYDTCPHSVCVSARQIAAASAEGGMKLDGPVRGACEDAPIQFSRSTDTLLAQWTAEANDSSRHPAARATSERYVTELRAASVEGSTQQAISAADIRTGLLDTFTIHKNDMFVPASAASAEGREQALKEGNHEGEVSGLLGHDGRGLAELLGSASTDRARRIPEIRARLAAWRENCAEPNGDEDLVHIFECHAADDIAFLLAALQEAGAAPEPQTDCVQPLIGMKEKSE